MSRRLLSSLILAAVLMVTGAVSVSAAAPTLSGSYATNQGQGAIQFTPVKAVAQLGYQGNFVIGGKKQPGMLYYIRGTSDLGLVWYYGSSGIQAGTARLTPTGTAGAYSGTIEFDSRSGAVTATGTVDAVLK